VVRYLGFLSALVAVVVVVLARAHSVSACPHCDSEIGRQVRAGIFNDHFWSNAALTLLPIPILVGIVALIHFGIPWPGKGGDDSPHRRPDSGE
jgi:hypothetical protein